MSSIIANADSAPPSARFWTKPGPAGSVLIVTRLFDPTTMTLCGEAVLDQVTSCKGHAAAEALARRYCDELELAVIRYKKWLLTLP